MRAQKKLICVSTAVVADYFYSLGIRTKIREAVLFQYKIRSDLTLVEIENIRLKSVLFKMGVALSLIT